MLSECRNKQLWKLTVSQKFSKLLQEIFFQFFPFFCLEVAKVNGHSTRIHRHCTNDEYCLISLPENLGKNESKISNGCNPWYLLATQYGLSFMLDVLFISNAVYPRRVIYTWTKLFRILDLKNVQMRETDLIRTQARLENTCKPESVQERSLTAKYRESLV